MRKLRILGVLVVLLAVVVVAGLTAPPVRGQIVINRDSDGRGRIVRLSQDRPLTFDWFDYGGQIGASVRDVESADIAREKLEADAVGAVVEEVDSDGPAAKAGLKAGDVVAEYDGETVRSARHLIRLVRESRGDRAVKVVVIRAGRRTELTLTPSSDGRRVFRSEDGGRTFRFEMPELRGSLQGLRDLGRDFRLDMGRDFGRDFSFEMTPSPFATARGRLGVTVQDLNDQLAEYFGVKNGVLVTSVTADTAASKAGLKAGDVITSVNGRSIERSLDLTRELRGAESGKEASLVVMRDRKTMTLKATLEDRLPVRRLVRPVRRAR